VIRRSVWYFRLASTEDIWPDQSSKSVSRCLRSSQQCARIGNGTPYPPSFFIPSEHHDAEGIGVPEHAIKVLHRRPTLLQEESKWLKEVSKCLTSIVAGIGAEAAM